MVPKVKEKGLKVAHHGFLLDALWCMASCLHTWRENGDATCRPERDQIPIMEKGRVLFYLQAKHTHWITKLMLEEGDQGGRNSGELNSNQWRYNMREIQYEGDVRKRILRSDGKKCKFKEAQKRHPLQSWKQCREEFRQLIWYNQADFIMLQFNLTGPLKYLIHATTGISSEMRTKLRDWAVWQARAGCYSQAALSSNDSKTL